MPASFSIRPAQPEDQHSLSTLISFEYHVHRHLDWRMPLDWLGSHPFWLLENNRHKVSAALACPPDPPEIPWIRFFASATTVDPEEAWRLLFVPVLEELKSQQSGPVAALALQDWFARLLLKNNFYHRQDIVVLSWEENGAVPLPSPSGITLRPLFDADLQTAQVVDALAFDPLWRISLETLARSYRQSAYASIAEMDGEIVGYQISTASTFSAHLARLAVHPRLQHCGIGSQLVLDLQDHFNQRGVEYITVNTQSDNEASLALYRKLGFELTGERFPVFVHREP